MPDPISLDEWKNVENLGVEVPRQEIFYRVTHELSDFLASLPISRQTYDKLLQLVLCQTFDAEHSGYLSGLEIGAKLQKQLDAENDDTPLS